MLLMASVAGEEGDVAKDPVLEEIIVWASSQPDVRALVLTSSRAIPGAPVDRYSNYDLTVCCENVRKWYQDRAWLAAFGEVVRSLCDPMEPDVIAGLLTVGNIAYYPGTRKIDLTLWPIEMAQHVAHKLPRQLDAGSRILLDEDDLTGSWASASGCGHAIQLPDGDRYRKVVDDFFGGVAYVVTALLRGELLQAKWVLDYDMRYEYLLPMLELYAAVMHGSDVRPGSKGKGLQPLLPAGIWHPFGQTYADLNASDNRVALDTMVALFRESAECGGAAIGCTYPADVHDQVAQHVATLEESL